MEVNIGLLVTLWTIQVFLEARYMHINSAHKI